MESSSGLNHSAAELRPTNGDPNVASAEASEVVNEKVGDDIDEDERTETPKPASYWVKALRLEPHPIMSGGFFKETFKDPNEVEITSTDGKLLKRPLSTLIYYLHLPTPKFGRSTLFHQSRCSSVMMHHYSGKPCSLYFLTRKVTPAAADATKTTSNKGLSLRKIMLGARGPKFGETCQAVIMKGTWFTRMLESGAEPQPDDVALDGADYSLVGVTVSPGFHYDDLKTATYDSIVEYQKDLSNDTTYIDEIK